MPTTPTTIDPTTIDRTTVGLVATGGDARDARWQRWPTDPRGSGRAGRDRAAPSLLLFDIDGTLIEESDSGPHLDAIYSALRTVYGLSSPGMAAVETWGKTDLEIAREILSASGHPTASFHERAVHFCSVAAREHIARCSHDFANQVIDGVPELLADLARRPDVQLGLLTGNVRAIARLKLTRARIGHFFSHAGGFGGDAEDRAALPAIARARAGTAGCPHPRERTWIIGDTPRDVRCAEADGLRCLAVTSGPYNAEELRSADHVARNTDELRTILDRELERGADDVLMQDSRRC